MRQMKSLLSEGIRSTEIQIGSPSTAMLARCVIALQWIPEKILRSVGKRAPRWSTPGKPSCAVWPFAAGSDPALPVPGIEPNNCSSYSRASRTGLSLIEKGISMSIVDRLRYDGKRALVVGGATGMGAAAAKAVGELSPKSSCWTMRRWTSKSPSRGKGRPRDPASIDAALKQVEGPIHAVFSAAEVADGTTDLLKINFIGHRHLIDRLLEKNQLPTARRSGSSPRSPAWAGRTT